MDSRRKARSYLAPPPAMREEEMVAEAQDSSTTSAQFPREALPRALGLAMEEELNHCWQHLQKLTCSLAKEHFKVGRLSSAGPGAGGGGQMRRVGVQRGYGIEQLQKGGRT